MDSKIKKPGAAARLRAFVKKPRFRLALVLTMVALVLVAAGVVLLPKYIGGKTVDVAQVSMVSSSWWGEQKGTYGTITSGGTYNVYLTNNLLPANVFVTQGQEIEAGARLFEYDMTALELAGESASISYKMAQNNLDKAKALLAEYGTYTVYVPPEPVIVDGIDAIETVDSGAGSLRTGSGTKEDPYVYKCDLETRVGAAFLNELTEILAETPVDPGDGTGTSSGGGTGTQPPQGGGTQQGSGSGTPSQGGEGGASGEGGGDGEQPAQPEVERAARYARLDIYCSMGPEMDSVLVASVSFDGKENEEIIKSITEDFTIGETLVSVSVAGEVSLNEGSPVFQLSELRSSTAIPEPPKIPENQRETQEEIDKLIADQKKTVRDLEIALSQAKIDLQKALSEIGDRTVLAEFGGTVTKVADPSSMEAGSPFIVIATTAGYSVEGTVSENNLEYVKLGDKLRVVSYSTGSEMTATVTEISDTPQQWGNSMSAENPNSSYYTFRAVLETDQVFDSYTGVEIYFDSSSGQEGSGNFYIPALYVREADDGSSYVLKVGEDGRMVRQPVETGKKIYGSMVEICSGLTAEDYIGFPYGKNAVEGATPNYDGEIYY